MNKKIMLITTTLVAGAAVVLLFDSAKDRKVDPRVGKPMLAAADVLEVAEIAINKGDANVKLVLDTDKIWRLNDLAGFPADAAKVSRALDDLSKADVQVLAAANSSKEGMNEFGFESATKVTLNAAAGKELFTASFANQREKGGQYVSIGGEYKVYLIGQSLSFVPDVSEWEAKTLLNVSPDQIKKVEFVPTAFLKRKPIVLSRDKVEDAIKVETVPEGSKEAGSIRSHESILTSIGFTNRVDPENEQYKAAMAAPSVVNITLFDGRTFTANVGSTGEAETKKYFLRLTGVKGEATSEGEVKNLTLLNDLMSKYAFEVSSFIGGRFEKGQEDMLEKKDS
jgi:hypothetical protein